MTRRKSQLCQDKAEKKPTLSKQAGRGETNFVNTSRQEEDNFPRSGLENGRQLSKRSRTDADVRVQYEADQDILSLKKGKFEGDKRQLSKVAGKFEGNADGQKAIFQKLPASLKPTLPAKKLPILEIDLT